MLANSFKWYHIYTWYQSCKMMVPQVILNFKWSSNEECTSHFQEFKFIKDPMCDISRNPISGIYKWCHSNNQMMSIKNARFKLQPSTPNSNLWINKKHTFYRNWWQRGRNCTKIWKLWDWDCTKIWKLWERLRQRSRGWTWIWTKREQHWRKEMDQNFLDKRSTQVGGASSWTLIDCIWYVHIHVLACIA